MTERFIINIARFMLGGVYLLFGLNYFFGFFTLEPLERDAAIKFMDGLHSSQYFMPFLRVTQVILGVILVLGFYIPLVLVMLMPITLNVFLFNLFMDPSSFPLSFVIMLAHLYLLWVYRSYYSGMFKNG